MAIRCLRCGKTLNNNVCVHCKYDATHKRTIMLSDVQAGIASKKLAGFSRSIRTSDSFDNLNWEEFGTRSVAKSIPGAPRDDKMINANQIDDPNTGSLNSGNGSHDKDLTGVTSGNGSAGGKSGNELNTDQLGSSSTTGNGASPVTGGTGGDPVVPSPTRPNSPVKRPVNQGTDKYTSSLRRLRLSMIINIVLLAAASVYLFFSASSNAANLNWIIKAVVGAFILNSLFVGDSAFENDISFFGKYLFLPIIGIPAVITFFFCRNSDDYISKLLVVLIPCFAVLLPMIMLSGILIRILRKYGGSGGVNRFLVAVTVVMCCALACGAFFSAKAQIQSLSRVNVDDTVTLGTFEQDGDTSNGKEAMTWTVYEVSDGKALLISDVCIYLLPYNENGDDNSWTNSTVRAWLNNEFYDTAFSEEEKECVCETEIGTYRLSVNENSKFREIDGEEEKTIDRVFVPHIFEYWSLTCEPEVSDFAKEIFKGNYGSDDYQTMFWIRNPYEEEKDIACGYNDESKRSTGYTIQPDTDAFVRPAVFVDARKLKQSNKSNTNKDDTDKDNDNENSDVKYYTDRIDQLNNGLTKGEYKQVLYGKSAEYCLKQDGTIFVTAADRAEQEQKEKLYSKWTDIVSMSELYDGNIVGLKKDGTAIAPEGAKTYQGNIDVTKWEDIVQLESSNSDVLLGLRSDGTVLYTPTEIRFEDEETFSNSIKSIVDCALISSVETKGPQIMSLTSSGRVESVNDHTYLYYNGEWGEAYKDWSDIKEISICSHSTDMFGLTKNGSVVYAGEFAYGDEPYFSEQELTSWSNVSAISAGAFHLVALKSDGTVIAAGDNSYGQCDVSGWKNIVRIEAHNNTTFAYSSDGHIFVTGIWPKHIVD